MASDLFLENKEILEEGIMGNIYEAYFLSISKKQKYILLYTYITTSTHNQPNPISPTARIWLAWLLLHTVLR